MRKVANDVLVSQDRRDEDAAVYRLSKGEYVTMPHELHMRDERYYEEPDEFKPERFLVTGEDGKVSANIGTTVSLLPLRLVEKC